MKQIPCNKQYVLEKRSKTIITMTNNLTDNLTDVIFDDNFYFDS